jgi:hypothetical protein
MAHFVFPAVTVILSVPFVAISYNAAAAQERGICSQARSQCGTQPVCQRRYQACMETGCFVFSPQHGKYQKNARRLACANELD